MEIKEAIKSLKNIVEYWTYKPTETEAAKLAIQALEKQIQTRVHENEYWDELSEDEKKEWDRYFCNSCDAVVQENYAYCVSCGQKLDWN